MGVRITQKVWVSRITQNVWVSRITPEYVGVPDYSECVGVLNWLLESRGGAHCAALWLVALAS